MTTTISSQLSNTSMNVIKIDSVDHHSCDVDWSEIDSSDSNINYDPTMCFTLEKKSQNRHGNDSILKVYTGYAKKYKDKKLDSGKCYQFRLKQINGKELTDWVTVVTETPPVSISDIVKLVKREKLSDLSNALKNESNTGASSVTLKSLDSVNDQQISPLMQAAVINWAQGAEVLLDISNDRDRALGHIPASNANYVDPVNLRSALMMGCRYGSLKTIELLSLKAQPASDWDFADVSGLYALHWIVDVKFNPLSDAVDTASIMLDWINENQQNLVGFNWNVSDRFDGWTALHRACARGASPGTIIRLIEYGRLSVHEQENKGQTPLMLATLYGHYEIVSVLLNKYGSDLADRRSSREPYRSARDLIYSATNNRRLLKEVYDKY